MILARVLGVRLLTLETTAVLAPADVRVAPPADAPFIPSSPASRTAHRPHPTAGQGLAEAIRSLDEAAVVLADVERDRWASG